MAVGEGQLPPPGGDTVHHQHANPGLFLHVRQGEKAFNLWHDPQIPMHTLVYMIFET